MGFNWGPVYIVNLAWCMVLFILGCWGYRKRRDTGPLLVGIAFGLFGISHFVTLFGLAADWTNVLIGIRVLAYVTVIYALYKYATMKTE